MTASQSRPEESATGARLVRPPTRGRAWRSFVADEQARGRAVRALHEEGNPRHRLRVEHDDHTLLVHLSDEAGDAWTTVGIDRVTRRWAVSQGRRQSDTAREVFESLYESSSAS